MKTLDFLKLQRKAMGLLLLGTVTLPALAMDYHLEVGDTIYLNGPATPCQLDYVYWTPESSAISVEKEGEGAKVTVNRYEPGMIVLTCSYGYSYETGSNLRHQESDSFTHRITIAKPEDTPAESSSSAAKP